ncbi:MAG: hypothetical protein PHR28_13840 [candidate division Zixibacteria bacterium]|jgi:uncharacterized membrane protein|nr:hypothetical protein [candidate division Zixibacteria bacterium]
MRAWTIIVFTAALQIALSILFHIDIFHAAYPGMEFNTITGEFVPVNDSISSMNIYHDVGYLGITEDGQFDLNQTKFSLGGLEMSFDAVHLLGAIGMLLRLAVQTVMIEYMMLEPIVGWYVAALVQAFFYLPIVIGFIQWLTGRGASSFA